jgi:hypothetical protein
MYAALTWEVESRTAVWDAMQTRRPRDAPLPLHAVPANTGILSMQALASSRKRVLVLELPIPGLSSDQLLRATAANWTDLDFRRLGNLAARTASIPSEIAYRDVDV